MTGGDKSVSVYANTMNTYRTRGIAGFYHGGTALIIRQGRTHVMGMMMMILHDDDSIPFTLSIHQSMQGLTGRVDRASLIWRGNSLKGDT